MSDPTTMAQSPAQSHRPPFPQAQSYQREFQTAAGARPNPFLPQSPQMNMPYSSPSPQQFSPQQYPQPPAAKRPRLSPDAQSPHPSQSHPSTPVGQVSSPGGSISVNGIGSAPPRPGLMAPPQRPIEKSMEDRNYDDILSGTGINIEEEARNLTRQDYFNQPTSQSSFQSRSNSFEYHSNSFGRPGSSGSQLGSQYSGTDGQSWSVDNEPSTEDRQKREEARADWEAARHSQYPLWDMFLYGGNLNEKVRKIGMNEHILDSQSGVMVNTQKQGPPPVARVNGLEGASRIIDRGQAVLDTGQKGERLSEVMKLLSLATKSRLAGLVNASARLSLERRQHSQGKVPTEWEPLAVLPKTVTEPLENVSSPARSSSLKRTHSQANSDIAGQEGLLAGPVRIAANFQKLAQTDRAAEDARRAKRTRRKAAVNADGALSTPGPDAVAEAALAAALDPEKKTTKKERKLAESKFSEQQQHKSANEAARMAVSGLMGSRFSSKKSRTYDWMNAGKGGTASPSLTPGRSLTSGNASGPGTPSGERVRPATKDKLFGQWNDDKDPGIQARDILLVLEMDGKASRPYVQGYSILDN